MIVLANRSNSILRPHYLGLKTAIFNVFVLANRSNWVLRPHYLGPKTAIFNVFVLAYRSNWVLRPHYVGTGGGLGSGRLLYMCKKGSMLDSHEY